MILKNRSLIPRPGTGRVIDANSGKPISGAHVRAHWKCVNFPLPHSPFDTSYNCETMTDSTGRFSLSRPKGKRGLVMTEFTLTVTANGYIDRIFQINERLIDLSAGADRPAVRPIAPEWPFHDAGEYDDLPEEMDIRMAPDLPICMKYAREQGPLGRTAKERMARQTIKKDHDIQSWKDKLENESDEKRKLRRIVRSLRAGGLKKTGTHPKDTNLTDSSDRRAGNVEKTERPRVFVQSWHRGQTTSADLSPDGKYVVSASEKGSSSLLLWDVASGRQIHSFGDYSRPVRHVVFSRDGQYVLSGGNAMCLWEVVSGKQVWSWTWIPFRFSRPAFSPDGKQFLSITEKNRNLRLHDTFSRKAIHRFGRDAGTVTSSAFSPDGRYVLAGYRDAAMRMWDLSGRLIRIFKRPGTREGEFRHVSFSSDGGHAMCAGGNHFLIWEVASGQEVFSFEIGRNKCLSYTSNGSRLLVNHLQHRQLELWDTVSGKKVQSFFSHDPMESAIIAAGGKNILSGHDKSVKLWDAISGKEIRSFEEQLVPLHSAAFSPDGRHLLVGYEDLKPRLWDMASGKMIRAFDGHANTINALAFSPDGRFFLSGSNDWNMKLWDVASGDEIRSFRNESDLIYPREICAVGFGPDGKTVLAGCPYSSDPKNRLMGVFVSFDLSSGVVIRELKTEYRGGFITMTPCGKYALCRGALVDAETLVPAVVFYASSSHEIVTAAYSPGGEYVLTGSRKGELILWDARTGGEIRKFRRFWDTPIASAAFSPDGKYVLAGGGRDIRLYGVNREEPIRSFEKQPEPVVSVLFRPGTGTAVSLGGDHIMKIWDAALGREICRFHVFKDGEWAALTPSGFYNSSPGGHKYLNVRNGNEISGIEDYGDRFNRPDEIRKALQGMEVPPRVSESPKSITVSQRTPPLFAKDIRKRITNSIGMEFVYVHPPREGEAKYDFWRYLAKGFHMQATPVTQAQWETIMDDNPSEFAGCENCPVENLSHADVS